MHYVSAEGLTKSYGIKPLFRNITFHIEEGDRIALVAKNGSGKTTLLKILAGQEVPDEGKLWIHKDVTIAFFEQDPVFKEEASVIDNLFSLDHPVLNTIKAYEAAMEEGDIGKINASVIKMDELGAWDFESQVKQILSRLRIDTLRQPVGQLSGGQRKRLALARTLIDRGFENRHVLLIMDEPTNHLDVEMVEWLENLLNKESLTLLLVTHDRYFLDTVCNEIWELNAITNTADSKLFTYRGHYENYLEKKTQRIEIESASIEKAKNEYRKELEWMRKQPRARTTKSKSRIDRFSDVEVRAKTKVQDTQLQLQSKMNRLGGKVIELKKLNKSFGDQVLIKGFDYTFKKGERIGMVGKNGSGKTTFLNMLQGLEPADSGKINVGETVVFGYYSQQGLQIKEDMRVIEYVKSLAESFPLTGGGSLSAAQFLELFLFPPDQQYTYLSRLSGGEKRRLHLLSVLFRNPNFLILDEPTNDLDLPTLAVLENFLAEFQGCILIVSHDRFFMDRLVDHLFIFEGNGVIRDFPGNYSDYRAWKSEKENEPDREAPPDKLNPLQTKWDGSFFQESEATKEQKKKRSYKEKREFELLGDEIHQLSEEKEALTRELNSGNLSYQRLEEVSLRVGELTSLLDKKELRWLELSEMAP